MAVSPAVFHPVSASQARRGSICAASRPTGSAGACSGGWPRALSPPRRPRGFRGRPRAGNFEFRVGVRVPIPRGFSVFCLETFFLLRDKAAILGAPRANKALHFFGFLLAFLAFLAADSAAERGMPVEGGHRPEAPRFGSTGAASLGVPGIRLAGAAEASPDSSVWDPVAEPEFRSWVFLFSKRVHGHHSPITAIEALLYSYTVIAQHPC